MVERLIIHAGAPKTATTFIQRGLHSNSDFLAEQGVYLPASGRLELEPHAVCHHHLAWALISPERYAGSRRGWDALAHELTDVDAPTVVLSSEAFSRVASQAGGAEMVADAAKQICADVRIVYFVRNQLSLMNSLYGQRIKSLRMVQSFDYHTNYYRGRRFFNYQELLAPWYEGGSVSFVAVPFTGSRDVDPLAELLRVAGVDTAGHPLLQEKDDVNTSLGPVGIEAARLLGSYLRGVFPDFDSEEIPAKKLYRLSSSRARANGWCDESFWGWTPETAQQTVDYFTPSNDSFARAVWGHDWDIEMPVDKATSAVRLLDLDPPTIERIHRYVFTLAGRFAALRAEAPAS
jgi:hypothetical protein